MAHELTGCHITQSKAPGHAILAGRTTEAGPRNSSAARHAGGDLRYGRG
jgi:hypothetical protein